MLGVALTGEGSGPKTWGGLDQGHKPYKSQAGPSLPGLLAWSLLYHAIARGQRAAPPEKWSAGGYPCPAAVVGSGCGLPFSDSSLQPRDV